MYAAFLGKGSHPVKTSSSTAIERGLQIHRFYREQNESYYATCLIACQSYHAFLKVYHSALFGFFCLPANSFTVPIMLSRPPQPSNLLDRPTQSVSVTTLCMHEWKNIHRQFFVSSGNNTELRQWKWITCYGCQEKLQASG